MPQQLVVGLMGGMSWETSAEYYRIINSTIRNRLGGLRSARCLMWPFDFGEIEALQHAGRWENAAALLWPTRPGSWSAGTAFFLICTNTMHRVIYDELVQGRVGPDDSAVPPLDITRTYAESAVERAVGPSRSRVGREHGPPCPGLAREGGDCVV